MRINNIRKIICADCGDDKNIWRCVVSKDNIDVMFISLCGACYLDKDDEFFKEENSMEKREDY